jgi:uncharacterized RDD family membrane protein YckC
MFLSRSDFRRKNFKIAFEVRLMAKIIDMSVFAMMIFIGHPFATFLGICYLAVCDFLFQGQSLGKRLMGFKVVDIESGEACSLRQSLLRNLPFWLPLTFFFIPFWGGVIGVLLFLPIVGIEAYLLHHYDSGLRMGDVLADTTVNFYINQFFKTKFKSHGWFDAGPATPASFNSLDR